MLSNSVCLTLNLSVVGLISFEQETLHSLLSTGWFQEQFRAGFHNQTIIH